MADTRYFLRLGDIPGDSTDARHAREIEVLSFAWGVHAAGGASLGGGGGAGKVVVDGVSWVARTGPASPAIFLACAQGEHLRDAVLSGQRVGEQPFDALTITLTDVLVTDYAVAGGGADGPMDQVTLRFGQIQVEQTDGATAVRAGWDLGRNTAI